MTRLTTLVRALLPLILAGPLAAQLADLQPGRNFPDDEEKFDASDSTEDMELGDVDNDGDLDVVQANGGNNGPRVNRLQLNVGGFQGGVPGNFFEVTAVQWPGGLLVEATRDAEFADWDDDGDLDLFVANSDVTGLTGGVSRAYANQGGMQFGTRGHFTEVTDPFFASHSSVPLADDVDPPLGDGAYREFSCDCDFGDLDDDGDLDLFHSSYGPGSDGTGLTRLYLNDGLGSFDELFPWADGAADTAVATLDLLLVDLDEDDDLDLVLTESDIVGPSTGQARLFRNNARGGTGGGEAFTDMTAVALPSPQANQLGLGYEVEAVDLEGDGDFDLVASLYESQSQADVLRNRGGWLFDDPGDPVEDDATWGHTTVELLDYDGDGDLDLQLEDFIYQSGVADGVDPADGTWHQTDGPGLAPWPEIGGIGWWIGDAESGDLDGDGDPDLVMATRTGGTGSVSWENELGVPDTHAPVVARLTDQADKNDGSDTPIHARITDNASMDRVESWDVRLVYSVDGGDETCVPMTSQGGQQFRAVIPGGLDGLIAYRVEALDGAGNTGVSAAFDYQQDSGAIVPWRTLGCGTQGVAGVPVLRGFGDQVVGQTVFIDLQRAAPAANAALFLSVASTPAPFKGGTLYTLPVGQLLSVATDPGGQVLLPLPWPAGAPSGFEVFFQYAIADAAALGNVSLSNALVATAP